MSKVYAFLVWYVRSQILRSASPLCCLTDTISLSTISNSVIPNWATDTGRALKARNYQRNLVA